MSQESIDALTDILINVGPKVFAGSPEDILRDTERNRELARKLKDAGVFDDLVRYAERESFKHAMRDYWNLKRVPGEG